MFPWAIKVYPWCRCSTRPRDSQTSYSIPGLVLEVFKFSAVLGEKVRGSSKLSASTSDPMVQGESLPRSIWLFRQANRHSISRHGITYQCTSTLVPAPKLGCPLDLNLNFFVLVTLLKVDSALLLPLPMSNFSHMQFPSLCFCFCWFYPLSIDSNGSQSNRITGLLNISKTIMAVLHR